MDKENTPSTEENKTGELSTTGELAKTDGGKPKRPWLLAVLATLAIIAVGLTVWLIFFHDTKTATSTSEPIVYNYSQQQPYSLPGITPGTGMTYLKPSAMVSSSEPTKYHASFLDQGTTGGKQITIAGLESLAKPPKTAYKSTDISSINKALSGSSSSSAYIAVTTPLQHFVAFGWPKRFTVTLGKAQPFTNKAIKSNAWQFDVTIFDSKGDPHDFSRPSSYLGKLIYAIGGKTNYYLSLFSVDYNWASNAKNWQQVYDSLKIDQ